MTPNELTEAVAALIAAETTGALASAQVHSYRQLRYDHSKDVVVVGWRTRCSRVEIAVGGQGRLDVTLTICVYLFASTADTQTGQRAPGVIGNQLHDMFVLAANRSISAGGDTATRNSDMSWTTVEVEVDEDVADAVLFEVTYRIPPG